MMITEDRIQCYYLFFLASPALAENEAYAVKDNLISQGESNSNACIQASFVCFIQINYNAFYTTFKRWNGEWKRRVEVAWITI